MTNLELESLADIYDHCKTQPDVLIDVVDELSKDFETTASEMAAIMMACSEYRASADETFRQFLVDWLKDK